MKKRLLAFALTLAMALSLTVPAMAAGQTFSDVPESYWGYADIEAVSKAGYMKGVGGGRFSPENKVTVAQFLALLGRLVFPDVKTEGNDWFEPYVTAAKDAGLLTGSQVDPNNVEAEITRYDMAVILRAAAKKLGVAEKSAQSSEVTDYGMIPNMYTEAVLAVYGMGLIKGVGGGSFNGTGTMRRAEVATVIMRLARAVPGGIPSTTEPDPEKPTESPEVPVEKKMVTYTFRGYLRKTDHVIGRPVDAKRTYLSDVPFKVYYTEDGGETSTLVYEGVTGSQEWNYNVAYEDQEGKFVCSVELPEDAFSSPEKGLWFSAETELDGQRLVTGDLRTDGRAFKEIQHFRDSYWQMQVELTPPEGEKAHFTFQGYVEGHIDGEHIKLPNFTIQMHLADGRLVNETVTAADGTFSMECEVDALDDGFSATKEIYYVTASGEYGGVTYEHRYNESLYKLHVCDEVGRESDHNYRFLFIL